MPVVDAERLLSAVRRNAGLDGRPAERTLRGVLVEVGACLTWRAAYNLADCLPRPYAGAVRAGVHEGTPARFAPGTFLAAVAERDGIDAGAAARRARAVFEALRECLPRQRYEELAAELARFGDLLGGPPAAR